MPSRTAASGSRRREPALRRGAGVARLTAGHLFAPPGRPADAGQPRIDVEITSRPARCRGVPYLLRDDKLQTGTVKWFNATKGYGFIQPEGGGPDAFVHISAVERAGLDTLREGERVQYELVRGKNGKSSAENLKKAS